MQAKRKEIETQNFQSLSARRLQRDLRESGINLTLIEALTLVQAYGPQTSKFFKERSEQKRKLHLLRS